MDVDIDSGLESDDPFLDKEIERIEDFDIEDETGKKRPNFIIRQLHAVRDYGRLMLNVLGWRFIVFLFFSHFLGKGMLRTGASRMLLPLFKSLGDVDAFELQIYTVLVTLPWSMKPLMGLSSDFITIGGYQKRYWLVVGAIIGMGCSGIIFFFQNNHPLALALCFSGISFQLSTYDLLAEGKYSEIRNQHPEVGSSITNLVQAFINAGALCAMIYVGFLSDHRLFWVMFIINACLSTSLLFPTLMGWMPEHRLVNAKWIQLVSLDRIREEKAMIIVIAMTGIGGIVATLVATLASPLIGLIISLLLLIASLAGCWFVFPKLVTQVAMYQVVTTLCWPSMGGALGKYRLLIPSPQWANFFSCSLRCIDLFEVYRL